MAESAFEIDEVVEPVPRRPAGPVRSAVSPAVSPTVPPAVRVGLRERLFVPTLVALGLILATLSSLGAPLIPAISRADHVSLSTGQWILTGPLLVGVIASPIMGQLADGARQRAVILWSLSLVLVGSVIAASVDDFTALMVGRLLQGVGFGLVPVAMAIARRRLPLRRSTTVIGILSVTAATGIGLGYPLTGIITETFDYHVAFWIGAGAVVIALALAALVLPSDRDMDAAHSGFDVIGAVLFSIGLVALITALSEGELWGWLSAWVLALVAVAAITLSLWVRAELRVARPLVVLAQFRIRAVLGVNASAAVVSIAMYLFMPLVVEFVQIPRSSGYGFGASVAIAGLCLVPLSAGTALASPLAVWIRDRFGARVTITLAQLLFAGGILLFALRHAELWEAFVTMGIAGVAVGLSFSVMPGVIVAAVPADEVGAAMGLYQVIRWTGAAAGSAASATILAAYTATGHDLPSVMGYQLALIVASILCLLVIGLIFLIPPVSRVSHQASVATVAPTVGAPVRP